MFNEALTVWSMCPSGFSLFPTTETVLPSFVLWEVQGYLQNGSTSTLSQKRHIFPHLCQHTALLFSKVLHCIHVKHYLIKLISSIYTHFYLGGTILCYEKTHLQKFTLFIFRKEMGMPFQIRNHTTL